MLIFFIQSVNSFFDTLEQQVDDVFRTMAAYVDRIAKGDATIIAASGFSVSKQPATPQRDELAAVTINGITNFTKPVMKVIE